MGRLSRTFEAFRDGLADLGYVEGQNIDVVSRFAEGQYDRFPALIDDLVCAKIDVLAVQGAVTLREVKKTVIGIPVVFAIVLDPVRENLVADLARPGGNITGVTTFDPHQPGKQIELFKRVLPRLRRVALLGDAGISEALIKAGEEQAQTLGLRPQRLRVAGPTPDLDGAFAAMRQAHADALIVMEEPVLVMYATEIAQLGRQNRIPTMSSPIQPDAGQLLAYGTSFNAGMRHMAVFVDKILKGAKAGDLPVETLTQYELIVNLKTASKIGVTIPSDVLQQADRVIQ
jgi:putative ABC transport system substrate-binding protein